MKKILPLFLFIALGWFPLQGQPNVWINEIHYDNNSSDSGEGFEVVIENASSYNLGDFTVTLYNGNGGTSYGEVNLNQCTLGTSVNGFTFYYYYYSGIQNGAPDGLCLSYQGSLIPGQFLSYEGTFTATEGPANGVTSTDIGVSEDDNTTSTQSLQLSGSGSTYAEFIWQSPSISTFGNVNNNQTLIPSPGDTQPPVWTTGYPKAIPRDDRGTIIVNLDEPGTVYAVVLFNDATPPTSQQVKAGADYDTVHVLVYDSVVVTEANKDYYMLLGGATPETDYDIWLVAQDNETPPNIQTDPVKLDVTTTAPRSLDMTKPEDKDTAYIGGDLHFEWTSQNIDSLYIGAYVPALQETFIITDDNDQPIAIPALLGSFDFPIPQDAFPGYFNILLFDAADTSYYDQADSVLLQDKRVLEWVSPQDHETYYVGDIVYFKWHAEYIDSIYIGGYDYTDSSWFMIPDDDNPMAFPANLDSLAFPIPLDASTDSVRLIIYNADDTTLQDIADPVYLLDTIKPEIEMLMPDNGKTDVPYAFTAVLAFSENVTPLTGNIYLHKEDGTVIATFDVTTVQHEDNVLALSLPITLDAGTTYYFTMDAGAVEDYRHNVFGGISDPGTWRFTTAAKQLYFSEYVEGSGNNKALEIFNPTDQTVDLSEYGIMTTSNGSDWYFPAPLHGMLAPGDVYTIVHPDFDFSLLADSAAVVDTLWGAYINYFNGDDARGLVQLVGGSWDEFPNYTLIDVIGEEGIDPGSGWDVAGVASATQDHTLIRKNNVETGNIRIGWDASAGTDAASSEWIVLEQNFVANLGYPTPNASDNTTITAFELRDTVGNLVSTTAIIDSAAATVSIEVIYSAGHMVDSLVPVVTVADDGSAVINGDTLDFTNPVTFTVTAEDGLTTRDWTVTVTIAAAPSTDAAILAFSIPNQMSDAVIDAANHTVAVVMPYGTDVTALTPALEVSAGASVTPAAGEAQDFTNPVVYTVTAEDGTTTADWTVTVTAFEPPVVGIFDVQYTTDASGDSPYKGQMVRTSGIVTALNIYQGAFKGYFLQDTAAAWNGIYVYDPDHDTLQVGDSVTIVGTVDEYYNFTEIKNIQDLTVVSQGNTLPGPVDLTTGDAAQEKWEGVFVTFHNATCLDNNLGYGEISVDDGSGALVVDDFLYQYDPASDFTVNNIYNLTGVMNYTYGAFKLNPRSANDISDVTGIDNATLKNSVRIYPNPSSGIFFLTTEGMDGSVLQISVMNTLGKVVYTKEFTHNNLSREQINLTEQAKGLYFIRIESGNNAIVKRIIVQ